VAIVASGTKAVPVMPRWINHQPGATRDRQRERWLTLRQSGLGASDWAAALGVEGAYSSPFALFWAKQPGAPLEMGEMTEEQEWGLRIEDAIADKFAEDHPDLFVFRAPAHVWQHPELPWALCTPDRLTYDFETGVLAPLELKTDQNPQRWGDDPPECYWWQLLAQVAVFGGTVGYMAALIGKRYRSYRIEFTPEQIADGIERAGAFWSQVQSGVAPDVDGHDSTRVTLIRISPGLVPEAQTILPADLIESYESADDDVKAALARLDEAKNRVRAAMGSAGVATDVAGRKVASHLVFKVGETTRKAYVNDQIRRAVKAK
jgi:putative phage-type endonuclease